jgi:hypothetical protein
LALAILLGQLPVEGLDPFLDFLVLRARSERAEKG